MQPLSAHQRDTLRAAIDRIIPKDDYPSASENHVDDFIEILTQTDFATWRPTLVSSLETLDQAARGLAQKDFASTPETTQDEILQSFQSADWFQTLVRITNEGYYTDRSRHSNLEHISWKMIGYDPGIPADLIKGRA